MGVVVRRYIDIHIIIITFPYSICIHSFLAAASLLLCSFFFFLVLVYVIFVQYSKRCSKYIRDRFKSRDHTNIINYINKNVERTSTARAR